jgi:hypothetical protein
MKMNFGKISGQLIFRNILFKLVEVVVTILADSLTKCSFLTIFG